MEIYGVMFEIIRDHIVDTLSGSGVDIQLLWIGLVSKYTSAKDRFQRQTPLIINITKIISEHSGDHRPLR